MSVYIDSKGVPVSDTPRGVEPLMDGAQLYDIYVDREKYPVVHLKPEQSREMGDWAAEQESLGIRRGVAIEIMKAGIERGGITFDADKALDVLLSEPERTPKELPSAAVPPKGASFEIIKEPDFWKPLEEKDEMGKLKLLLADSKPRLEEPGTQPPPAHAEPAAKNGPIAERMALAANSQNAQKPFSDRMALRDKLKEALTPIPPRH